MQTISRRFAGLCLLLLLVTGCSVSKVPEGVSPVKGFEVDRYLGTWYEIARLDHVFERGMHEVTAEYTRRDDGGIQVINRGYLPGKDQWKTAKGKAYFIGNPDIGHLKVSFFGPFYGGYIVFELDQGNYEYAFVSGPDTDYLWLLSRTPTIDETLYERFVQGADELGFDTRQLIRVDHTTAGE